MSELIEKVAFAIHELTEDPESVAQMKTRNFCAETWIDCYELARAAVSIVLEECAKVADRTHAPFTAFAIRALAEERV